jgi:hypothetical protein
MLRRSRQVAFEGNDPATGAPVAGTGAVPVTEAAMPVAAAPARVNPGAGASLGTIGFLTVLCGAWAGIVPFIGPIFGYNATGTASWTWNLQHALIWLAPGAVAVFFGLLMIARSPLASTGLGGRGHVWSGLIVALCGGWLVVGPIAWAVAETGRVIRPSSPWVEFLYFIGYSLGPGLLLALFGGIAMGISLIMRRESTLAARPAPLMERRVAA